MARIVSQAEMLDHDSEGNLIEAVKLIARMGKDDQLKDTPWVLYVGKPGQGLGGAAGFDGDADDIDGIMKEVQGHIDDAKAGNTPSGADMDAQSRAQVASLIAQLFAKAPTQDDLGRNDFEPQASEIADGTGTRNIEPEAEADVNNEVDARGVNPTLPRVLTPDAKHLYAHHLADRMVKSGAVDHIYEGAVNAGVDPLAVFDNPSTTPDGNVSMEQTVAPRIRVHHSRKTGTVASEAAEAGLGEAALQA